MARRYKDAYKYDIDVSLDGKWPRPSWVAGTLADATQCARREGARMASSSVFRSVRVIVRRRADNGVVFDWQRKGGRAV